MNVISAGHTHIGRRQNNEDAFHLEPDCGLFIVADGMGGYEGGEVASQLAVSTVTEFFVAHERDEAVTWPFGMERELSFLENKVMVAVRMAHRDVIERRTGKLAEMGATVVVLAVDRAGAEAVLAHMGDSRIYRLRDLTLSQLTRDHSFYNQLADSGMKDLPSPEHFVHKNIITRALGFPSGGDRPELRTVHPRPDDVYLLCSDGLCDVVPDAVIAAHLLHLTPQDACKALVQEAYDRGGRDNITAVVVAFEAQAERR